MQDHQKLVEIFLASTLHEAKNQLVGLRNSLQKVLKSPDATSPDATTSDATTSKVQHTEQQLETLNRLLNQVLTHYRSLNSDYTIHTEEILLTDFFEEIADRLQPSLNAHQVSIRWADNDDTLVFIDEQMINNVMDTLIWNAVSAGATEIQLSCDTIKDTKNKAAFIQIIVDDNGPGFTQHTLNQPLDALKPADAAENKTGLGLYFANAIVAAHSDHGRNGYILLENHVNKPGARVSLFIP